MVELRETIDFAAALCRLPDAVVVLDSDGAITWWNEAAERLFGGSLESWHGRNGLDLVHPADLPLAVGALGSVQDKVVGSPIELRLATLEGWRLVELVGSTLEDHLLLSIRDLSRRRRWELATDDVARLRAAVHHAAGLTVLLAPDGTVQSVSGAVSQSLGHDPEQIVGQHLAVLAVDEDRAAINSALLDATGNGPTRPVRAEIGLRTADAGSCPFELTIVSLVDDPAVGGFVVSGHDIRRLREAQTTLERLASYDSLTGLPNRRAFDAGLDREWMLTQSDGIDSIVVVADLDGFKQLNDRHGHAAGDRALQSFAECLRRCTRDTDLLARLGGDEFAVVLVRCGGEAAAVGFGARLRDELDGYPWPGGTPVKVSIGHQSLRRSTSPSEALHQADMQMLAAKDDGAQR